MARRTTSRLELRKQAEAVENRETDDDEEVAPVAKRKAAAKKPAASRAKRTKEKVQARKKLVWVVLNGSMKEEARFPYDQRAAAEEKIEQLKLKSNKKLYFIQPLKEVLGESTVIPLAVADDDEEEPLLSRVAEVEEEVEVELEEAEIEEEEDEDEDDDDSDEE